MDNRVNHTLQKQQGKRRTEKLEVDEWIGKSMFGTVKYSVALVRGYYRIQLFTFGLPWPEIVST